ncbi:hypothetical protein M422DRAFT_25206 [Sphaerobolus stellatus SS14]|nr:hypothetical protein M422DRAFT_25206 [Sphaerobolus stellatus SS14]
MADQDNLYTCEIIFIRADHAPVADIRTLSCDPYIKASLQAHSRSGYSETSLRYRTQTMRRTLNPVFNSRWIVSGVPANGFTLTINLIDEDTKDSDDRLGRAVLLIPNPQDGPILKEGWDSGDMECKIEKRRGSLKTYLATYFAAAITRGDISHHVRVWVRIRILGKTPDQKDRRLYTLGPPSYVRHFSPLIGHFVSGGTAVNEKSPKGNHNKSLASSTFIANRLQLRGPPPKALRLRYVGYAPFIRSLFKQSSIRGKILHYALKRQFNSIYGYNKNTIYGVAGDGDIDTDASKGRVKNPEDESTTGEDMRKDLQIFCDPKSYSEAMARQFLRMTSYGTAGRIFTYAITLDSEWHFTETGEEFSVDLLSKHAMHADAAKEITFSGEFFVRRINEGLASSSREASTNGSRSDEADAEQSHNYSIEEEDNNDAGHRGVDYDPKEYELVIDNNSGTYRPQKELLPIFQKWLAEEGNLAALGKVTAMDGFDETLKKWKKERQDEKRKAKGLKPHQSSEGKDKGKEKDNGTDANKSDNAKEDDNDENGDDGEIPKMAMPSSQKGRLIKRLGSVGSIGSGKLGSRSSSVSSDEIKAVLKENAKRAEDNQDKDDDAKNEEKEAGNGSTQS